MPRRLGTCQALKQCRLGVKNEEILGLQRGNASFAFAKFRMAKELSDGVQCFATGNCCASPDFPGFATECSGTAWHSMARDGTEHKQTTSTFGCSFDAQTAGIGLAGFPTQFSILLNLQSFKIFKASDRFQSVSLSQCFLQGLPSRARGDGSWIKRLRDTVLRKKC